MESLRQEAGPHRRGDRRHRTRLRARRPGREGPPDAGALEDEGRTSRLYGGETVPRAGAVRQSRRANRNTAQVTGLHRFFQPLWSEPGLTVNRPCAGFI